MRQIVEQLKAIREGQNMSLSELARKMGTERSRLSEIERGKVGLTLKRLYQWAEALGVEVNLNLKKVKK